MNKVYEEVLKQLSEEDFQKLYDLGFTYEKEYHACSQSIVGAFVETIGIDKNCFLSASGLAAGIGLTTEGQCGAYIGGAMVIGNLFGRHFDNKQEIEKVRYCSGLVRELRGRFIKEYGTTVCKEIQTKVFGRSYNLLDPEGFQSFEEAGAHVDKCPNVVGKAARWVGEILLSYIKHQTPVW